MNKKSYKINVDEKLSGLAGFPYGEEIYKKQIKPNLTEEDYENGFIIVFPTNIERIASSFVQGFFAELIKKIGFDELVEKIEIRSSSKELSKNIIWNLE